MKRLIGKKAASPRSMELLIGHLLRAGVVTASIICALGGILYMARYGHVPVDYSTFEGTPQMYRTLSGIWGGLLVLEPMAVIQAGVVVLLAIPVLRVLFSAFVFLAERDYLYVGIACTVLAIILINMIAGAGA